MQFNKMPAPFVSLKTVYLVQGLVSQGIYLCHYGTITETQLSANIIILFLILSLLQRNLQKLKMPCCLLYISSTRTLPLPFSVHWGSPEMHLLGFFTGGSSNLAGGSIK